jgi:CDP-diglyceride synthetase
LKRHPEDRLEKGKVQGAALTILSLLMGFTFSVAMAKFETQRTCDHTGSCLYQYGPYYVAIFILTVSVTSFVADLKEYIEARIRLL